MSTLKFHIEWEDPKGAKGEELRATWGALRIEVLGDNPACVTRLFDQRANTVRDRIYAPLYPMAEWIAFNWHRLLYDAARGSSNPFSLHQGGEGFAVPALRFMPEGSGMQLSWEPRDCPGQKVQFSERGSGHFARPVIEQALADFVEGVCRRLNEMGVESTPLQDEWSALLSLDMDQRQFCTAAAALGLDPFDMSEALQDLLIKGASIVDADLLEEFLPITTLQGLSVHSAALSEAISQLGPRSARGSNRDVPKHQVNASDLPELPWLAGYELARRARESLFAQQGPIADEVLWELVQPQELATLESVPGVEGVLNCNCTTAAIGIGPVMAGRRQESRRFTLSRLLGESLQLDSGKTSLVTSAVTHRQRLNRAFAAEFLVPSSELQRRIDGGWIAMDAVQDLADEFAVSSWVVEHQIRNHRLARLEDT